MSKLIPLVFLFCSISISTLAQEKYLTRTGMISFEASVPAFEEVKATSKNATGILNTENGEFASLVIVTGFRFKNALMEEHFNENYMESGTYPKASFKGKIIEFDNSKLTDSPMEFALEGDLLIHGKTKKITTPISLSKEGEKLVVTSAIKVKASDFDISIPKIVSNKIAEDIEIKTNFTLEKK